MIIYNGNSYCLECMFTVTPELSAKERNTREKEALEGLSELF